MQECWAWNEQSKYHRGCLESDFPSKNGASATHFQSKSTRHAKHTGDLYFRSKLMDRPLRWFLLKTSRNSLDSTNVFWHLMLHHFIPLHHATFRIVVLVPVPVTASASVTAMAPNSAQQCRKIMFALTKQSSNADDWLSKAGTWIIFPNGPKHHSNQIHPVFKFNHRFSYFVYFKTSKRTPLNSLDQRIFFRLKVTLIPNERFLERKWNNSKIHKPPSSYLNTQFLESERTTWGWIVD